MNQHAVRLIDILTPPGNRWLADLARRRELPAGVRVVRFGSDDDDLAEDGEAAPAGARRATTRRKHK